MTGDGLLPKLLRLFFFEIHSRDGFRIAHAQGLPCVCVTCGFEFAQEHLSSRDTDPVSFHPERLGCESETPPTSDDNAWKTDIAENWGGKWMMDATSTVPPYSTLFHPFCILGVSKFGTHPNAPHCLHLPI